MIHNIREILNNYFIKWKFKLSTLNNLIINKILKL